MPETREASSVCKALLIRSGGDWCVLPLPRIRRLLTGVKLFPLPGASAEVAGLAEVEGEPVVVLSLERLIGTAPGAAAEFPVVLLVEVGPAGTGGKAMEVVGLLADDAADLVNVDESQIVGPARGLVRGEIRLVRPSSWSGGDETAPASQEDAGATEDIQDVQDVQDDNLAVRWLDLDALGGNKPGGNG